MTKKKLPVRFTGQHFTIDKVLIKDAIRQANISNQDTDNKAVEERIQPGADCRQEPLGGNCDGISRNDISLDLGG